MSLEPQEPLVRIGSVVEIDGVKGEVVAILRDGISVWIDARGRGVEFDRATVEKATCA